jgi:hypothetical protein
VLKIADDTFTSCPLVLGLFTESVIKKKLFPLFGSRHTRLRIFDPQDRRARLPPGFNPGVNRCGRLAKDWENLNRKALAFLRLASIRLMLTA